MTKETDIIILDREHHPWYITQEEFERYFQPEPHTTMNFDEIRRKNGYKLSNIKVAQHSTTPSINLFCHLLVMTMLLLLMIMSAFQTMKSFCLMLRHIQKHQPLKDWLNSIRQWNPLLPPGMSQKDILHWKTIEERETI